MSCWILVVTQARQGAFGQKTSHWSPVLNGVTIPLKTQAGRLRMLLGPTA